MRGLRQRLGRLMVSNGKIVVGKGKVLGLLSGHGHPMHRKTETCFRKPAGRLEILLHQRRHDLLHRVLVLSHHRSMDLQALGIEIERLRAFRGGRIGMQAVRW